MSLETTGRPALVGALKAGRRALAPETAVFYDFLEGLQRWHLWRALAWRDIRSRYRRTVIGPFWTALNTAIFVAALGAVYALLWHQPVSRYLPYFCAGYISWYFFLTMANESGSALIVEAETVKTIHVPYSVFIFRVVMRNLIVFLHNLSVFVVVGLIFQIHWGWSLLLVPVGFLFILPNYFWMALLLATICARFRDVIQLVSNITQILFFVTPVFWRASELKSSPFATLLFVRANPAYRFVDVIRAPLLGHAPSLGTYLYLLLIGVLGGGATVLLLRRVYGRIAYWL